MLTYPMTSGGRRGAIMDFETTSLNIYIYIY